MRVKLLRPAKRHETAYLRAVERSRELYRNVMQPTGVENGYSELLRIARSSRCSNFFAVLRDTRELVGAINIEGIIRGFFQSASLGYYAFVPHAGKGLMREGLILAINHAFRELRLHRLEANVQPANRRSIDLVRSLGFEPEGFSPRFLKICGRWRDHERWALRAEDWRMPRMTVR